jgi:hypothetical protein
VRPPSKREARTSAQQAEKAFDYWTAGVIVELTDRLIHERSIGRLIESVSEFCPETKDISHTRNTASHLEDEGDQGIES